MKLFKQPGSNKWYVRHCISGRIFRKSTGTSDKRKAETLARKWARKLDELHAVPRPRVKMAHAKSSYLDHCRRHGLAHNTLRGYDGRLQKFVDYIGDGVDLSTWDASKALDVVTEYLTHRIEVDQVRSNKEDRLVLSGFFNFLKYQRWYRGENPAAAKLHQLRRPRKQLKRKRRTTTREDDLVIRKAGQEARLWPILLLTRWAGLRRGEACALRWSEINLAEGYLAVFGHEGGRKHPRERVWLAPWVVMQLKAIMPNWLPAGGEWPLWPHHPDTATDDLAEFCEKHLERSVSFTDLRASWVTEVFGRGMSATEEAQIGGHSPEVADRYYSEFTAEAARDKLPPDPLWEQPGAGKGGDEDEGAGRDADPDAKMPGPAA